MAAEGLIPQMGKSAKSAGKTGRHIVIIDDEAAVLQYMSLLIRRLGYQVTTSERFESVDFCQLSDSDIVFIDLLMPGTDGIQVLDVLSKTRVPASIVLMSGHHSDILATAERIARGLGLRVAGTLRKPFRKHDLQRLLECELEESGQASELFSGTEVSVEDIQRGMEAKEFDVFLQPIFSIPTAELIGYEALARWNHADNRIIGPDQFIPVAGRHGILPQLSHAFLNRALQYASILKKRASVFAVSINLGSEDLIDSDLPERLCDLAMQHDIPAESITVELTEISAVSSEITFLEVLARLRLKGIRLAIDDFGTAYASLQRLSIAPFTSLKIDRRFIGEMLENANARTIVQSSISLAKRLRLLVVAEGVETEEQFDLLRKLGCDAVQGYYFAKPMPFNQLTEWMAARRRRLSA